MKTFSEYKSMNEANDEVLQIVRQRTEDHIDRVKYFYNKLIEGGLIPERDIKKDMVEHHDEDKLQPRNLRRQALRFTTNGELSNMDAKDVYDVIRDHVKTNPHHAEFWGKPNEDHMSKGIHCETMLDSYIYEMMADWASTAEERGTKIIDWYNKCIDSRWYFNQHQKQLMLKCIEYLQKLIEPGKKREYGLTYVDPAVNSK